MEILPPVRAFGAQGDGVFKTDGRMQRHPEINKIARWAIWHIFLAVLKTPHFASETEKFAVSASLRSAQSVCKRVSLARGQRGKEGTKKRTA